MRLSGWIAADGLDQTFAPHEHNSLLFKEELYTLMCPLSRTGSSMSKALLSWTVPCSVHGTETQDPVSAAALFDFPGLYLDMRILLWCREECGCIHFFYLFHLSLCLCACVSVVYWILLLLSLRVGTHTPVLKGQLHILGASNNGMPITKQMCGGVYSC